MYTNHFATAPTFSCFNFTIYSYNLSKGS